MTLFNIGPVEFIAILLIMFIVLGPEGMVKTARTIGVWIRKTVKSPMWGEILGYSREIRDLPTKIVRETGLDEDLKEIQKAATEATKEAQIGLTEANQELQASLKDAGTVDVKVDVNGAKSGASTAVTVAEKSMGTSSTAEKAVETKSADASAPVADEKSAVSVAQEVKETPVDPGPKPPIVLD